MLPALMVCTGWNNCIAPRSGFCMAGKHGQPPEGDQKKTGCIICGTSVIFMNTTMRWAAPALVMVRVRMTFTGIHCLIRSWYRNFRGNSEHYFVPLRSGRKKASCSKCGTLQASRWMPTVLAMLSAGMKSIGKNILETLSKTACRKIFPR